MSSAVDDGVRFDGYVAPGKHLITFRVEATGKDDDTFTSTTETQIVVKAVPNKDLVVSAKAHDGVTGIWSNTVGFAKTEKLFQKGATDGDRLKRWTRRQQQPSLFWYSAYPTLTNP